MRALLLACAALCIWTTQSVAKAYAPRIIDCDLRGCRSEAVAQPRWTHERQRTKQHRQAKRDRGQAHKVASAIVGRSRGEARGVGIVDHPSGCPRTAFCGCGVAVKVFGKPIRDLWLAANWFKFKTAAPAPGMVAVRRHHVFVVLEVLGHNKVLAYDPNSGGHKTRIHLRSLAGYRVVDPRSS